MRIAAAVETSRTQSSGELFRPSADAVLKREKENDAMFAELNELLGASVEKPEQGKLTLLCADKTDASFLLHHFLSFYLKAGCKVCFVALLQSFSHYNIVAQKLGVSLAAAKERGQLVFLEGLKSSNDILFGEQQQQQEQAGEASPFQFLSGDGSNLKALYEFVRRALSPAAGGDSWRCPVLLVDNLGILLGLGVRLTDILDFIHYCRVTVNAQLKGNLIVMLHSSSDSEDEENELLVKAVHHQSNRILLAEGLVTGYCKDVHGQLSIIQRSSWERKAERDLQRIYQYKIQDRNVVFFARGMSAAVL